MAKLKIYIPETLFEEGGTFAAYADRKHAIQMPMVGFVPTVNATFMPKYVEETQFQPATNKAYAADLAAIRKGLVVVEKGGVVQTEEDMINIFKTYYQEL